MDGRGNTGRMDTTYNAITFHQGRASGHFNAPRLIPPAVRHTGDSVQFRWLCGIWPGESLETAGSEKGRSDSRVQNLAGTTLRGVN